MSALTPGEWYADGSLIKRHEERLGGVAIASVYSHDNIDVARLMAAAPALLWALCNMVDDARDGITDDLLVAARAAIAKATKP